MESYNRDTTTNEDVLEALKAKVMFILNSMQLLLYPASRVKSYIQVGYSSVFVSLLYQDPCVHSNAVSHIK